MKNNLNNLILFLCFLLFSCNMGKHYANMRASRHDSDREEIRLAEEKVNLSNLTETKTDSVYSCPTSKAETFENNFNVDVKPDFAQINKTEVEFSQPEVMQDSEQNTIIQEPAINYKFLKKRNLLSRDWAANAAIFLIFVLPILVVLSVFLISWIFVAASIALRIALWTLVGIAVFELVLFFLDSLKG